MSPLFQMAQGGSDGIVQSSSAGRLNPFQSIADQTDVACEVQGWAKRKRDVFVEIHHKKFVLGIACLSKCQGGGNHTSAPVRHALAVVENQPDGCGVIF